ncbi:PBECR2 nuclease fold domain-containing protein [Bdellovibrio bacteriovorus]|uniref:PBECR2 nuclease fold domain-containing protein n=1 Tax=Bdellovibrio bacteriovorus TaxID=959 RepID=UPI0021D201AD|nr:PBECR2 nuclease fold domain-containing protein [Bdellovibrio bacteriovorus]UXR65035.1 PBECR2 nuclease fold domain-containing protein [Bdellovibrio bacteriovorus]
MAKTKTRAKKKPTTTISSEKEYIIVDEAAGLIFESEEDLFGYFREAIDKLEEEYSSLRSAEDFSDEEQIARENYLEPTLDEPDEVWMDDKTFEDFAIYHFIRTYEQGDEAFKYVAVAYVSTEDEYPTFVFIHFPSRDSRVWQNYQRGEMVYDKNFEQVSGGSVEGDAMGEGDPLAVGLYQAMLKVRAEKDIPQDKFQDYADLREETIENADEIWRKNDLDGNILVSFIREFPDHETTKDLIYIAVTQEDEESNVHSLLFSFPTTDKTLADRYRQGENLQAEEVSQESAH